MLTDPTDPVARLRAWFEVNDPEVLAVADDVDRTLIGSSFAQTPFERLDRAVNAAKSWARRWSDEPPRNGAT